VVVVAAARPLLALAFAGAWEVTVEYSAYPSWLTRVVVHLPWDYAEDADVALARFEETWAQHGYHDPTLTFDYTRLPRLDDRCTD
jgi:hypothetical protein